MNILLTGSSGLIGSSLMEYLFSKGHCIHPAPGLDGIRVVNLRFGLILGLKGGVLQT